MAQPIIGDTAISSMETGTIVRDIVAMMQFYRSWLGFDQYPKSNRASRISAGMVWTNRY